MKDGTAQVRLRVACNDRRPDASGKWVDGDTTYLDVTAWRALAEAVADQLVKGDQITVTGKLKSRTVEHPENGNQTYFDVDADTVAKTIKRAKSSQPSAPSGDPWGEQSAPF
jgi:single-strand DNA-binding protein